MDSIEQLLKLKYSDSVFAWRNNTGVTFYADDHGKKRRVVYGLKGSSDYIGLIKPLGGRFLGIEAKAPGGKLSKHQELFRDHIMDMNGLYILAYNAGNVDDILQRELKKVQT